MLCSFSLPLLSSVSVDRQQCPATHCALVGPHRPAAEGAAGTGRDPCCKIGGLNPARPNQKPSARPPESNSERASRTSPHHVAAASHPPQQQRLILIAIDAAAVVVLVVVAVAQEAADGGDPGPADVALPRFGLGLRAGAVEARAHRGGGVEAEDGPAPAARHASDLGHLRGRQVPRVGLDVADGGAEGGAAGEVRAQLRHADGPAQPRRVRGALARGGAREVVPELLHHAAAHHVVDAAVQVRREERGVDVHPEEAAREAQRGAVGGGVGEGVVVGGGGERVGEEGVDEGVGSSRDDGDAAPGGDRGGGGGGQRAEGGGRERAGVGADGAEEVVRDAAAVRGGHLVGGDVEAGVELDLVGVHHLPAERQRRVDGQLGLAGARGAHDRHHAAVAEDGRRRGGLVVLVLLQWRGGGGGHGPGGGAPAPARAHERSDPIGEEAGHVGSAPDPNQPPPSTLCM
ncbi:hypothetical protein U9M48_044791 [Paspalum notatum var. saurae]|uniref:Uncharacterized protein n=1 Tax=Paspalum notatum var. saurae TaxID=547442 RepID=A0AAQ3XHV3_PASNO